MTAGEGVNFRVVDVDTFSRNEVVGRCFCPATVMQQAMESNTPIVMSLGEGCAYSISAADRLHCCHCRPVRDLALRPCPSVLAHSVGKLKVLVHGPLTSRSGMLMNNNAGMLEEKGSRNEQALATSRTAASVPASQAEAKQAKQAAGAKQAAEAKQAKQEADAKQASEAKLAKQVKQGADAKQASEAKLAKQKQAAEAKVAAESKKLVKAKG